MQILRKTFTWIAGLLLLAMIAVVTAFFMYATYRSGEITFHNGTGKDIYVKDVRVTGRVQPEGQAVSMASDERYLYVAFSDTSDEPLLELSIVMDNKDLTLTCKVYNVLASLTRTSELTD